MNLLALDLGGITGWAVGKGKPQAHGTWDIRPTRGESPGMRYLKLRKELHLVKLAFPDLAMVVYEQAHHRGGHATEYAGGCVGTVQAWASENDLTVTSEHSATIKKFIAKKGNAGKEEIIAKLVACGYKVEDDNEADAIAIFLLATFKYGS